MTPGENRNDIDDRATVCGAIATTLAGVAIGLAIAGALMLIGDYQEGVDSEQGSYQELTEESDNANKQGLP